MKLQQLALVLAVVAPANFVTSRPNNPCAGLPLCRLKGDTRPPPASRPRPPLLRSAANRRPKPQEESGVVQEEVQPQPERPAPAVDAAPAADDSVCAGLIFCKLSTNKDKKSDMTKLPPIRRPLPPPVETAPEEISFDFSEDLLSAVLNGNLDTAKELIEDGANVNQEDVHGNSVLHIASQNGRTDIIDDLLLNGAEVNAGNNHRNTALHLAAQNGWTEIARKLLRHRKIAVDRTDLHANTALHLAAQNGQTGVAQLLLEAGANVNQANTHKHTPLHLSAQNGHLGLSKLLVDAGADVNFADLIGNTPLHTAVHNTHTDIARMLVQNGGDSKKKNLSGLSPFQLG